MTITNMEQLNNNVSEILTCYNNEEDRILNALDPNRPQRLIGLNQFRIDNGVRNNTLTIITRIANEINGILTNSNNFDQACRELISYSRNTLLKEHLKLHYILNSQHINLPTLECNLLPQLPCNFQEDIRDLNTLDSLQNEFKWISNWWDTHTNRFDNFIFSGTGYNFSDAVSNAINLNEAINGLITGSINLVNHRGNMPAEIILVHGPTIETHILTRLPNEFDNRVEQLIRSAAFPLIVLGNNDQIQDQHTQVQTPTPLTEENVNEVDSEEDIFISFMKSKLIETNEPEYEWSYTITDNVDWLNDSMMSGNTLEKSNKFIRIAGCVLFKSLNCENANLCFEAIRAIMDWGGVYYPLHNLGGNKQRVEEMYYDDSLLDNVQEHINFYNTDNFDCFDLINSGWTKVWAALFNDTFAMLDSRVSKAMSNLLRQYYQENHQEIPEELPFPFYQVVNPGNNRFVEEIPYQRGKFHRIRSNKWLSKILKKLAESTDDERVFRYNGPKLRCLEARLFMMGG